VRGSVEVLPSAHPLAELLPAVYLEDDLARRFVAGLDPLLAPVYLTLDCLEAYLDPRLAPADFLPWLASWVGLELDETLPEDRRRALVAGAAALHHAHGTRAGLVRVLELATGGAVELHESGGSRWSAVPGADPPGADEPHLHVAVRVAPGSGITAEQVERLVRDVRPAHLPFTVEVLTGR
jgi:phage tail-like protein